jgi:proteic killer suppression protein
MDIFEVALSSRAQKELKKIPLPILFKLQTWIDAIKTEGLNEIRKRSGFHDEPLKVQRQGQRSIRLNKAYRAIYKIHSVNNTAFIEVMEINKHDYSSNT